MTVGAPLAPQSQLRSHAPTKWQPKRALGPTRNCVSCIPQRRHRVAWHATTPGDLRLRLSKERRMLFEEAQWRERDEAD